MGGSKSKSKPPETNGPVLEKPVQPKQEVDPRLPFQNYRQVFMLKNNWKAISRAMEKTAKDCMLRFLRKYPQYQKLHGQIAHIKDEERLMNSEDFEEVSMQLFNLLDEVMEAIEKVDIGIEALKRQGRAHNKKCVPLQYFKDMEEPFLDAVRETLDNRFNDNTEKNFRLLWQYVMQYLTEGYGD